MILYVYILIYLHVHELNEREKLWAKTINSTESIRVQNGRTDDATKIWKFYPCKHAK